MIAIISISIQGNELAARVKEYLANSHCYTLSKYKTDDFESINGSLQQFCQQLFEVYDGLIFIMATGIVVRSIAPWLKDKITDPAVVVMDDAGINAISLLSGHLGGANDLADQVAKAVGANPIITTASDVNKLPSVDMIALEAGLQIASMEDAKVVTACFVNRQKVDVLDPEGYLADVEWPQMHTPVKARIIVSKRTDVSTDLPFSQLIPRNVFLGVGCKKNCSPAMLWDFIEEQLNILKLDKRSVEAICSIQLKQHEPAILEAANSLQCRTIFYGKEELQTVEHLFEGSDFVKSITGVGSVSSAAAYLGGCGQGHLLLDKAKYKGMTISVFEQKK